MEGQRDYDFDLGELDEDYCGDDDRQSVTGCVANGEQKPAVCGNQQAATAHGAPKRAAANFEGQINFSSGTQVVPDADADDDADDYGHRDDADDDHKKEWDGNVHRLNPRGSDDTGSKVSGLPKRQFKLQQGLDVAVPDGGDDWWQTSDGDATGVHSELVRSELQALMQGVGIGSEREEYVLAVLADETYSAWSSFGGATAAACGVLLALDDERGKDIAHEQLRDKVQWWADCKDIERAQEAFESFCDKLQNHASDRVL